MMITSFSNPKIKAIRKLEERKSRQETGLFFIEGLRTVGEAIQTGAPIETLVIAPQLLISTFGQSLLAHPAVQAVETITVSSEVFERIAHKDGPQGIGAIVRQQWHSLNAIPVSSTAVWVALDRIADPGNLGSIMRTADASGCQGIILLGACADPHDPTAVKASMGSIFSLKLVTSDWESFLKWRTGNQIALIGTSDMAPTDYQDITYPRPLVLLMGSERHGLPAEAVAACDALVRIPMQGRADSLNVSVATGIVLYEIYNQSKKLDTIEP
ncbi:MAG: RNA methyltransferase [Chloroflexota bacterium]|nr:RNA methyltransferase [Chloroflexota bacterium]